MCPENKASLESVIAEHGAFVRASLRGLGVPAADLDDITQEVFWGVHRGLPAFDPALAPHPNTLTGPATSRRSRPPTPP